MSTIDTTGAEVRGALTGRLRLDPAGTGGAHLVVDGGEAIDLGTLWLHATEDADTEIADGARLRIVVLVENAPPTDAQRDLEARARQRRRTTLRALVQVARASGRESLEQDLLKIVEHSDYVGPGSLNLARALLAEVEEAHAMATAEASRGLSREIEEALADAVWLLGRAVDVLAPPGGAQ